MWRVREFRGCGWPMSGKILGGERRGDGCSSAISRRAPLCFISPRSDMQVQ